MPNWKYIVMQLAEQYHTPRGGGFWQKEYLVRTWKSMFDFRPGQYHDQVTMGDGNLAVFYNFFMTLANLPDIDDEQKIEKMLLLLKTIRGSFDYDRINLILKDGGYTKPIAIEGYNKELSQLWDLHPEIYKHGGKLFKQGHYANCVNEVCKAYNRAVQEKSSSERDGQDLMMAVFGEKGNLRVNLNVTETEINQQNGIKFLSAGLIKAFRNPTSHEPAVGWNFTKEECIEVLGLASLLFRALDRSTVV